MHTNEITHDTFIPRWFGRLGNNIQQISNGIYFCEKNEIHFTSPDHPIIEAIDLNFGSTNFKMNPNSHDWFYFFNGPEKDSDFNVDVDDLNKNRKSICEKYILPKLKIDHAKLNEPLSEDVLVIHIRSGDLYTHFPSSHTQNPLAYYLTLYGMFKSKVIFIAEDFHNPIVNYLIKSNIEVHTFNLEETYSILLRAKNIATSGAGSFAISAAFCSKNLENFYCSDLYNDEGLNPMMLKEQLNVFMAAISGNKYFKVGEWNSAKDNIEKILNYEENISFRRL